MIASIAVTRKHRHRRAPEARAIALVALVASAVPVAARADSLSPGMPPTATALAADWGPWGWTMGASSAGKVPVVAQDGSSAVQPTVSPGPTPGPIVPRGNPVGTVGIVAMVVVAAAGLWIYRVIRKGL